MAILKNDLLAQKAESYKRPLKHLEVKPVKFVQMEQDAAAFQGLKAVPVSDCVFPITIKSGDSLILDFGDHYVGYLHYELCHAMMDRIADSPVKLRFTFGEFPLEIVTPPEEYKGTLGSGWLQNEIRSIVFTPYKGVLERRYAFRYLKIERLDSASFQMEIRNLYADTVSAVSMDSLPPFSAADPMLEKIYNMSVKTLKECEQDVFEDGPKRDRRLWIGDLRLQALSDFLTFGNKELVKRCIYIFAAYRTEDGLVAPCAFPDSPPCVDGWVFLDYSLFFISCLYDYTKQYKDMQLLKELYPIAFRQMERCLELFDYEAGELTAKPAHIEWCVGLDKGLAAACVLIYTMKQLAELTEILGEDATAIRGSIDTVADAVLSKHICENGLYKTKGGQISWSSQIWLVLSNILSIEENIRVLEALELQNPDFGIHTPYLMHYYIDALYSNGLRQKAMDQVKAFWGQLVDFEFDCCPEIFNPADHFESPYRAAEINSACHAWSCTPIYWIRKFQENQK